MGFITPSDPFLALAFWVGMGALALTLVLALQIVGMRLALRQRQRCEAAVLARWRPLLNAALAGAPPPELPRLHAHEREVFLKFWLHMHESLRGEAERVLNEFARRLDCDTTARAMLGRGRARTLLAILILGHLRDASAWDHLLRTAQERDPVASIQACWALVQIDAARAVESLSPLLLEREDWPLSHLASILQEAGDACLPLFVRLLDTRVDEASAVARACNARLLRLAGTLRLALPPAPLGQLLEHASPEIAVEALRLVAEPALLPQVRALATHEDWRVRTQAARALGRIGGGEEVECLLTLMRDSQWWVRYRAAQALVGLPFMNAGKIAALPLEDRFAADMLRQVLAERATTVETMPMGGQA